MLWGETPELRIGSLCPPIFPCESFDSRETTVIQRGHSQAVRGSGGCDEEVEVADLLTDFLLTGFYLGKAFPDFLSCLGDFQTVLQQFPVAIPKAFAVNGEKPPFDFCNDHDAGKAGPITGLLPTPERAEIG